MSRHGGPAAHPLQLEDVRAVGGLQRLQLRALLLQRHALLAQRLQLGIPLLQRPLVRGRSGPRLTQLLLQGCQGALPGLLARQLTPQLLRRSLSLRQLLLKAGQHCRLSLRCGLLAPGSLCCQSSPCCLELAALRTQRLLCGCKRGALCLQIRLLGKELCMLLLQRRKRKPSTLQLAVQPSMLLCCILSGAQWLHPIVVCGHLMMLLAGRGPCCMRLLQLQRIQLGLHRCRHRRQPLLTGDSTAPVTLLPGMHRRGSACLELGDACFQEGRLGGHGGIRAALGAVRGCGDRGARRLHHAIRSIPPQQLAIQRPCSAHTPAT